MTTPYRCPACGTNRSRFNIIEQVVTSVKKDAESGEVTSYVDPTDPLQYRYTGEKYRVQCGICGIVEKEEFFQKAAERPQYDH